MNHSSLGKLFLFIATVFFLLSFGGTAATAGPSPVIGTVQKVNGMATVVRQGQTISAKIGSEIWENDTLRTGPDGSIGVVFNDDTLLSLGPGSVLVIDEFVFAPNQGKFSIVIRMLKGTAAYLSGLISKLAPESAHFETPSASIGIRGTKFVVKVEG
ncbi:MAG TPA: FecR family protein [Thermodesulfobacteriota bacterium]|nr:FecR family protein [Thermodesulfobacteriota bacterium]